MDGKDPHGVYLLHVWLPDYPGTHDYQTYSTLKRAKEVALSCESAAAESARLDWEIIFLVLKEGRVAGQVRVARNPRVRVVLAP